jgi:hypothetical protein
MEGRTEGSLRDTGTWRKPRRASNGVRPTSQAQPCAPLPSLTRGAQPLARRQTGRPAQRDARSGTATRARGAQPRRQLV